MSTTAIAPIKQFEQSLKNPDIMQKLMDAMPKHVNPERFIRLTLNAVALNPYLLEVDRTSLYLAVMNAAQTGLEPDPNLGHIFFVPRKGKATAQIGYKGLLHLHHNAVQTDLIDARLVRTGDDFQFQLGSHPFCNHIPKSATGTPTHVWATLKTQAGGLRVEVMLIEEVNRIRDACSEAAKSGKGFSPWERFYDAMACKTVLRRLLKLAPVSLEMQRAITIDEQAEIPEITVKTGAAEALKAALPEASTATLEDLSFDEAKVPAN